MSRKLVVLLIILLGTTLTTTAVFAAPHLIAPADTPNLTVEQTIRIQTAAGEETANSQTLASTETAQIHITIRNNEAEPVNFMLVELLTANLPAGQKVAQTAVCESRLDSVERSSNSIPTRPLWDVPDLDNPAVAMMGLELPANETWEITLNVKSLTNSFDCQIDGTATVYAETAVPIPDSCNANRSPRCRYDGWTQLAKDVVQILELPPVVANPIQLNIVNPDLGDAPDSTNHFGVAMSAYPGVQANFPTVFDAATGVPSGPKHLHSRPLHLGQGVTREREADLNPQRNLRPPTNTSNMDRRDDGINVAGLTFNNCQTATIPYRLTVQQTALDYFAEQDQEAVAYLNIWVDGREDGDWEDIIDCNGAPAAEHIVINQPIDLTALGIGTHNLTVVSSLVPWSNPIRAWLRVTLSDSPAPLPLSNLGLSYGDGRGPANAYMMGETEDFLLTLGNNNGPDVQALAFQETRMFGPDLAVTMDSDITVSHDDPKKDPPDDDDDDDWRWRPLTATLKINFANFGSSTAPSSRLTIQLDEQFRVDNLATRVMHYPHCNGNVCQSGALREVCIDGGSCRIELDLENFLPGDHGQLMIRTSLRCLTCIEASLTTVATLIPLGGEPDLDASNNTDQTTLNFNTGLGLPPMIISPLSGTVSENEVKFEGLGEPNSTINIFADGFETGEAIVSDDGTWSTTVNLTDGMHQIVARPAQNGRSRSANFDPTTLALYVDSSQLWNAAGGTLNLLDGPEGSNITELPLVGRNGRADTNNWLLPVIPGKNYTLAIPITCEQSASAQFSIQGFVDGIDLGDLDNDKIYEVSFMAKAGMHGQPARLTIACNGDVQQYQGAVMTHELGHVLGIGTGQPLEGVDITVIQQFDWSGSSQAFRHEHTRITNNNGEFFLALPPGDYEIIFEKEGYQLFRTLAPRHVGPLSATIHMTPCSNCDTVKHVANINESGFDNAFLTIQQGDTVSWQNGDLETHAIAGTGIDSGALLGGSRHVTHFATAGTFEIRDSQNPLNTMTVIVKPTYRAYLPLIRK